MCKLYKDFLFVVHETNMRPQEITIFNFRFGGDNETLLRESENACVNSIQTWRRSETFEFVCPRLTSTGGDCAHI
jgi:hypothetical protein